MQQQQHHVSAVTAVQQQRECCLHSGTSAGADGADHHPLQVCDIVSEQENCMHQSLQAPRSVYTPQEHCMCSCCAAPGAVSTPQEYRTHRFSETRTVVCTPRNSGVQQLSETLGAVSALQQNSMQHSLERGGTVCTPPAQCVHQLLETSSAASTTRGKCVKQSSETAGTVCTAQAHCRHQFSQIPEAESASRGNSVQQSTETGGPVSALRKYHMHRFSETLRISSTPQENCMHGSLETAGVPAADACARPGAACSYRAPAPPQPAATCAQTAVTSAQSAFLFSSTLRNYHAATPMEATGNTFSRRSSMQRGSSFLQSVWKEKKKPHLHQKGTRAYSYQQESNGHSGDDEVHASAAVEFPSRRIVTVQLQATPPPIAGAGYEEDVNHLKERHPSASHNAAHNRKKNHTAMSASDPAVVVSAGVNVAAAGAANAAAANAAAATSSAEFSFGAAGHAAASSRGFIPIEHAKSRLSVAGFKAAGGGCPYKRGGSVYTAACAAASLAAVSSYENSRRRGHFLLLLIVQLCLCGALLVGACLGFARMRGNTAGPASPGTGGASGFPATEGFSAARSGETVLRWTLLVSAVVACTSVLLKRILYSRMWKHLRKYRKRWRLLSLFCSYMHSLSSCFRPKEDRKEQQFDSTRENVLLQEIPSPPYNTHHGHIYYRRQSILRHIPTYHLHPVCLRNRREEAAALACALLLALCGAALVIPSVLVLDAYCGFSGRDWMQQSHFQKFPSFSITEAEQARLHAAHLCHHKGIVLCCLVLACLLSFSELMLLWLHRRVATAAAIAAGTAAAAALAATLAYPAFDRRLSSRGGPPPHASHQLLRASLSVAPAANSKDELEQQQHKGIVSLGTRPSDDIKEPASAARQRTRYTPLQEAWPLLQHRHNDKRNDKEHVLMVDEARNQRHEEGPRLKKAVTPYDKATAGEGKVRRICPCDTYSLWDAVLLLGYGKFLAGCVLMFAASILLHEQSCYRSTHAFLRKEALEAANFGASASYEVQYKLEEALLMPCTVGQEIELMFGSAVAGMMLIAAVNIICGIYGTICGWKRSPLLSSVNVLLNAIIIWMEFAACVGLYFSAAGLTILCDYSNYPLSQKPLPRFLAHYICSGSRPPFLLGWAAGGAAFIIVFVDFIFDFVLLCREIGGKVSRQVPGLSGVKSD